MNQSVCNIKLQWWNTTFVHFYFRIKVTKLTLAKGGQ